jgi:hypothetical protein
MLIKAPEADRCELSLYEAATCQHLSLLLVKMGRVLHKARLDHVQQEQNLDMFSEARICVCMCCRIC